MNRSPPPQGGGRRSRRSDADTFSLHCRGYDVPATNSTALKAAFRNHGTVLDVYVPCDFHTHTPRGFAYVEFSTRDEADAARAALDGTDIFGDGKVCRVMWAEGRRRTPGDMREMDGVRARPRGGGTGGGGLRGRRGRSPEWGGGGFGAGLGGRSPPRPGGRAGGRREWEVERERGGSGGGWRDEEGPRADRRRPRSPDWERGYGRRRTPSPERWGRRGYSRSPPRVRRRYDDEDGPGGGRSPPRRGFSPGRDEDFGRPGARRRDGDWRRGSPSRVFRGGSPGFRGSPPRGRGISPRARASPRRGSPRRASPRRASPGRGSPGRGTPPRRPSPRRSSPGRGSPRRGSPRRASPRRGPRPARDSPRGLGSQRGSVSPTASAAARANVKVERREAPLNGGTDLAPPKGAPPKFGFRSAPAPKTVPTASSPPNTTPLSPA